MRISDWSSDVCSSDLAAIVIEAIDVELRAGPAGEPVEIGLEHQVEIVEIARAAAVPARDIAHHLAGIGDLKQQRAVILVDLGRCMDVTVRPRSEDRRVGKECVSTCRLGRAAYKLNTKVIIYR